MEIKPGKFVVLTYDLYAGAGEPEETLMMRATDEMPDQFVFGVDQNILPSMLKRLEGLKQATNSILYFLVKRPLENATKNTSWS